MPAPPERALAAVKEVELRELPVTAALLGLRLLPARLVRKGRPGARPARRALYELMLGEGFVLLGDEPGREFVVGVVGEFWTLRGGSSRALAGAEEFRAFSEPGYAKAAMSFRAESEGAGSRLRTETRIVTTDPESRRKFARYWRLVQPGSALIRREWLRATRRRLERG